MKEIYAELENTRTLVRFPYDKELISSVKTIREAQWNSEEKAWVVPSGKLMTDLLFKTFKGIAWIHLKRTENVPLKKKTETGQLRQSELQVEKSPLINSFINYLKSRRYSENTIDTYSDAMNVFLNFIGKKPIEDIENNDVIRFNNDYILARGLSASYQNQVVNAIKLFFDKIAHKKLIIEQLHRPRAEKKLPNVLSKEEVKSILEASLNIKHRTMLCIIYACGLRRSELLNLSLKDIHWERMILIIRQSKGKKDRIVPLSDKLLNMIGDYTRACKPLNWLFEGQKTGEKYSEKSLENVLKQSVQKAGISKPVSLHWLRHSYATHLLENGTDLRYIQELLGHNSSRTTEIYTHVSTKSIQKIKSPFDDL